MRLIWKLLQQHISPGQLCGFFFANLFGMAIVLLGLQFYKDVAPVLSGGDSFIRSDFVVLTKRIGTLGSLSGSVGAFRRSEVDEVAQQPFAGRVGVFTPSTYNVNAALDLGGSGAGGFRFSTDMFFESVPDAFVDVQADSWRYAPGTPEIPIILPRSYLNLYNFGFAQSRSLPKISEGLMGLVRLDIRIDGRGKARRFTGRIVGFSTRLNTILVPQAFNDWANAEFGEKRPAPARMIVEVKNPADERMARFVQDKGYETEDDNLEAGRITYFLKLVTAIVLLVGAVISLLSFYMLVLSVYLLLQKNTTKLENLLLIGYRPVLVALPYQLLTAGLNFVVLLLACAALCAVRGQYMQVLSRLFPQMESPSLLGTMGVGAAIFLAVSLINCLAIRRKINSIRLHRD